MYVTSEKVSPAVFLFFLFKFHWLPNYRAQKSVAGQGLGSGARSSSNPDHQRRALRGPSRPRALSLDSNFCRKNMQKKQQQQQQQQHRQQLDDGTRGQKEVDKIGETENGTPLGPQAEIVS